MKRWHTLSAGIILALVALGLFGWGLSRSAAAISAGDTVVPMGPAQPDVRTAYHDVLAHLYGGGRVHRAASSISGTVQAGDFVIPGGLDTSATHAQVSDTLPLTRAYALRPGGVALLRSTVVVTQGQNRMMAMWELAPVRQLLDGYLLGSLPYTILDETDVVTGLEGMDLLIVPGVRADAVLTVTQALSRSGALDAIHAFVASGGTLYAQSNGAYVAEAAGLLPKGTVDLDATITLDSGADPNRGHMTIQQPDSPLAWSWLTDTLYVLTDPLLHPDEEMEVVATLANASDAPAVVRADAGDGQVILVAGHPTDAAHRIEAPIFMDAVLLALSNRAELFGDAIQTFNPAYDPHEFPAYERVPISVTLTAANLWDTPIASVVVTETVHNGYAVSETSIAPTPSAFYTITTPTTQTVIVWNLGTLTASAEVHLRYVAESEPDALAAGVGTFSTGTMTAEPSAYDDTELGAVAVTHRPFVLTAQMAARLVGDRDLEADRHYRIPAEGTTLDVALPLENKEWTLAHNVVVTDWVYLIYPIVDYENQHVILSANDGETIWMRNEPFMWENGNYPLPVGETSPTRTYTLEDWQGDWCVFTSTYGIHTDPPPSALHPMVDDYGSFVTIPPTYTDVITVTEDGELLLPCLPLTFDLGEWPGYWYEEPALRYGVHSQELFGREVHFHGTPREDTVVMPYDAGSVYVAGGGDAVLFREHLEAATPYAAAAPSPSGVAYRDVWSRMHFTPFRATFYDTWDWDTCATCEWPIERHAAINVTFGMLADLDGDGSPETPVREIPTRLPETQLTLMGKSYNLAEWTIPSEMNLIELPIFHGLGVAISPENESWEASWRSPLGHTTLVSVTDAAAYDHLLFQQDVPPGVAETFYVSGTISTYEGLNREGMFKLHDGARLIYRQMLAGPNRYEIYDSHVHSVLGLSSDGTVEGWGGPTDVSVYGDNVYYTYQIDDLHDTRPFDADPYMNSWGYGDFVATSYVGGRDGKRLLRSIVSSEDRTRARISLDNNTGVTLTDVSVTIDAPDWVTVTQLYLDPDTAPEPIWPELAFLNLEAIPDAWRGVYYFDLEVGGGLTDAVRQAHHAAVRSGVITIPVQIEADGLPAGYEAPPLLLGLRDAQGSTPEIVFGPARDLTLTDTLPSNVSLLSARVITEAERDTLVAATDYDAITKSQDTAAEVFAASGYTIPFTFKGDVVAFDLPEAKRTLPPTETLYVAARSAITRASHGPNVVGDGGVICYTDPFDVRWCEQGEPVIVEAGGAAVVVDYFCEGGSAGVESDGAGHCTIPPDQVSEITLRLTAYNEGDALARYVTATVVLPDEVAPVGDLESLNFSDVAPGGWGNRWVTLEVTPTSKAVEDAPHSWRLPVVDHTRGQFFDTAMSQTVSGQLGDDYAVTVLWKPRLVYLPLALRNLDLRPDLVIADVLHAPDDPSVFQVTVTNLGLNPARDFWVDGYLDPAAPPDVNQPWPDLSLYGAAWFVDELGPGESLTLTVGDAYYQDEDSRWPEAYPAGDHEIWAYADSWGHPQTYGAVNESDEGNNRYGPVTFTVTGSSAAALETELSPIPPRPTRPRRDVNEDK